MSLDRAAPSEGSATTAGEIADELAQACQCLRRVDYNALHAETLGEMLEAFHTMQDTCLRLREEQKRERARDENDDREVRSVVFLPVEVAAGVPEEIAELFDSDLGAPGSDARLVVVDTIDELPEFVDDENATPIVATVTGDTTRDSESNSEEGA